MSWDKTQKTALGIAVITSFLGPFLISAVNVALPAIEQAFQMNALALSWIVTAFLLSSAILLLPMGRWADITGVRRIFKIGVVIFTITTLGCGLSPSGTVLILFRFLQGIGGAMTMTTGPAILVSIFPPMQRGRVLGISVASVYMGLALGPFAGGVLTQQIGWRSIFIFSSALGLFASIITFLYLGSDKPSSTPRKINLSGSLVYALSLISLVAGTSRIPDVTGWGLMALGTILLVLFAIIENNVKHPVIELRLFTKNKLFTYSNIAALINYSATFAIVFLLSLYLQKIKDMTPQQAGTIILFQPIMMTIVSPIAGRLSERIQPRILATTGMAICTAGLLVFSFLTASTSLYIIILNLVFMGIGFGLFSSPNMNTIMSSVEKHQYGLASGISATMRVVGQMVSMTIVSLFFALYIGKTQISTVADHIFIRSMASTFLVFTTIAAAGIWFSYYRGNLKRESPTPDTEL
ncbi:MFS transporter [Alkaliflexus imshenetskii]|uniref:MFS transporter n=1 Tax=Alkaliflexus imshenetskii TaxID=286730 RepID=UPI000479A55A|nr:MFS transporter [Alkaliflexus imshenetskii]